MDTNKSSHFTMCSWKKQVCSSSKKAQFPLRPAAAKTVHRSQGDTQSQIVVNLGTKRAIPRIHYDIAIFSETRFSPFDDDSMYTIDGFQLFRNDSDMTHHSNGRPYGGTANVPKDRLTT